MNNARHRVVNPTVPASAARPHMQSWSPTAADSLALILRGLPVSASALMVGAHPDDEDTALLAELALRHGVRAVYLSLTRGEGGQNRIGPESGAAFGILRTGELLASRLHDGAEQLLSPCVDFGYAKRAEDAFAQWGREHVTASVVQAIREVQPDVVISVWTGTDIDGHGHHRASGISTHEAYTLAADASAFPEQIQAGLAPWQAKRLLVRVRDAVHWAEGDLHIDVGRWDPILGRSCFEVAMEGRSLHRCQNMGALRAKGAQQVVYRVAAGAPICDVRDAHALSDLPVRLDAWAQACLSGRHAEVGQAIETAVEYLAQAWDGYHPQRPEATAPALLSALRALRQAAQVVHEPSTPELMALDQRLQAHIQRVEAAWIQAAGIALEVLSPQPEVMAGEALDIEAALYVRGEEASSLVSLQPQVQPGWRAEDMAGPPGPTPLAAGDVIEARFRVTAPADEQTALSATLRPWLHLPPEGHLYRFPGPIPSLAPSAPPLLTVEALVQADDLQIPLSAPLVYREADPGFGEIRQPVRVIPRVMVDVAPSQIVVSSHATDAPMATIRLRAQQAESGRLVLRDLSRDDQPPQVLGEYDLPASGLRTIDQALPIDLSVQGVRIFLLEWQYAATPASSQGSVQDVSYSHIEPGYVLVPAELSVTVVSVDVAPDLTVGYVPGVGDAIPEALETLGVATEVIDDTTLQFGNLEVFDTIVVGVRALETRANVAANRERLWDYARAGGTLIMQYQKPREDGPERFIPFPGVIMARPVPRVSQKKAPVNMLCPDDPLLTFPNRIGPDDFDGWVQERGLYFMASWPASLRPLLESADAGEAPHRGGLMHARLGRGHYIYCAYALFRQLPAGVPGAYRLLANLVSFPRCEE